MKNKNNILYSVIIPIYNGANYIEKCINSILEQSYQNYEIILIDDGSTDDTKIVCNEIIKDNKKIRYIYQKNSGVSKARNRGIIEAQGEYITFIDIDDYIEPNTLGLINNILTNREIDIIKYSYYKEVGIISKKYKFSIETNTVINKSEYSTKIYPYIFSTYDLSNVWNSFFRKNILKNILFDETTNYAEDYKFMCEALKQSGNIYFIDESLYHYIYNANSAINKHDEKKTIKKFEDNMKVFNFISNLFNLKEGQNNPRITSLLDTVLLELSFKKMSEYRKILLNFNNNKLIDENILSMYNKYIYYIKIKCYKIKEKLKKKIINIIN